MAGEQLKDMGEIRIGRRGKAPHQMGKEVRILKLEQCFEGPALRLGGGRIIVFQIPREDHIEFPHAPAAAPAEPRQVRIGLPAQCLRSAIIFLMSAIARAGFRSFGQASAQFMIVWHR